VTRPIPTDKPCPLCLDLAKKGEIEMETVQRLSLAPPRGVMSKAPCCHDCAAAEGLMKMQRWAFDATWFKMARIAVCNDRREQYRLPGVPMGLVQAGLMRPSQPGDLEAQLAWLESHQWFGCPPDSTDTPVKRGNREATLHPDFKPCRVKRKESPKVGGKCCGCNKDVSAEYFCSGCRKYVCDSCDVNTLNVPMGMHDHEDHLTLESVW
jgi:hypothetical protein